MATVISYGAAGTVTGSCHLLEVNGIKILIDCGMFQGNVEDKNYEPFGFDPTDIDYLILTHAHIDHIGRVPKLVKEGFNGVIIATEATIDVAYIMLQDAAKILIEEYNIVYRKAQRAGEERNTRQPLYDLDDVDNTFTKTIMKAQYNKKINLSDFLFITFHQAGHIFGSAFIEVEFIEGETDKKVVFSGDIGSKKRLVIDGLENGLTTNTLYIESTYGDRLHKSVDESIEEFKQAIIETIDRGGNVMIPSFALERTQEILYILKQMSENKELENVNVFLDSPLAIKATELYNKYPLFLNEENEKDVLEFKNPFTFKNLNLTQSVQQSIAINNFQDRTIIIAGSGMCTGGRILQHFKHRLWNPVNSLIFVGYQVEGTLGRKIIDGAEFIYVHGEKIAVKAEVYTINGFSAHGDQKDMLDWINTFNGIETIYLVHGEDYQTKAFKDVIKARFDNVKVHIVKEREHIYI
jgi:metallo-beta-lactamase family protein